MSLFKIKLLKTNIKAAALAFVLAFSLFSNAQALTITPIKLELKGDPGMTLKQEVTLYNEHDKEEVFYISYANFEAQGETGYPSFSEAKDDIGTWMKAAEKVTLAPKSSQIVPLLINIPKDATPGGHFGVVFWGTVPQNATGNGVAIGAKTGVLVLVSVSGDVNEDGGIISFDTTDKKHYYNSLPIGFTYRFQNNGDDRIKPSGNLIVKNILGITSAKLPGNPVDGNILPSGTRKIEIVWQGSDGATSLEDNDSGNFFTKVGRQWRNFGFGRYTANLALSYGLKNQVSTAKVSFWVFPWHLTVFVLVLGIILYYVARKLIRKYNAWVIKKAEELLKKEIEKQSKSGKK